MLAHFRRIHILAVLLTLAVIMVIPGPTSAQSQIININSRSNNQSNPVNVFLEAGTYQVEPIGTADGGAFNAWNPWSRTSCTNPDGCQRTSPTTVTGWMNYHLVMSSDIVAVTIEGTPGSIDPTTPGYRVDDGFVYPTAIIALANAQSSVFALSASGNVGFAIPDSPLGDNAGGISLRITLTSTMSIFPKTGGDTGFVSVHIFGSGFEEGATVKLTRDGESDIFGEPVTASENGALINTTFDLTGKSRGLWDVVVTNPDNTTFTLADGFTIEEGRAPELWVDIVGLPVIRVNREQKYWVIVGNTGNVDAVFPGQTLIIAAGAFSSDDTLVAVGFKQLGGTSLETADAFDLLPAVAPTASSGECAEALDALEELEKKLETLEAALRELIRKMNETDDSDEKEDIRLEINRVKEEIVKVKRQIEMLRAWIAANCVEPNPNPPPATEPEIPVAPPVTMPLPITVPAPACYPIFVTIFALPTGGLFTGSALAFTNGIDVPLSFGGSKEICTIASFDPNDKIGSEGVEFERYLSGKQPLRYAIFFENLETATAPAQEVVITDQLDTVNMDLSTLNLGPIAFGDKIVTPMPGLSNLATEVDLQPDNDLIVKINVNLDPSTGVLTWHLTSIDPETGLPPQDPFTGFLPPNINPPEGDGSVLFTVMPKEGLATGTEIRNSASIVFDSNTPILTPEWLNTIDNTKPNSQVLSLPSTQNTIDFEVQWTGTDQGAGIRDYTIFVSEDGDSYAEWRTNTPDTLGTFSGENGKTYAFYSVARDHTGNLEEAPEAPDTATTVVTNQPPVAQCKDVTIPTGPSTCVAATASVDNGSSDSDEDLITLDQSPPGPYSLGDTDVTLTVTDDKGATDTCDATVTVVDEEKPVITSVSANPNKLWPPNHKMVTVNVAVDATDNCDSACQVISVESNEPVNGLGNGNTSPDWLITGDLTVKLRAERSGGGTSRIYTITVECIDNSGNSANETVEVTVPHDNGKMK